MTRPLAGLLVILLSLSACRGSSSQVRTVVLAGRPVEPGSIDIVFSEAARGLVVAIDGVLVPTAKAPVRTLHLQNVEPGFCELQIAAQGVERRVKVWVDSGKTTSVPVGAPPRESRPSAATSLALSLLGFLISRAASDYLF